MARHTSYGSSKAIRTIWFLGGAIATAFGAVGVVLPILPTTPFILLAAFCFARSSRRCHAWLIQHRTFGPLISNWTEHGAIDRRAKTFAVLSMVAVFVLSLVLGAPRFALILQAVILLMAGGFVLSRPLPPQRQMKGDA